jgi:hypothetical protein
VFAGGTAEKDFIIRLKAHLNILPINEKKEPEQMVGDPLKWFIFLS